MSRDGEVRDAMSATIRAEKARADRLEADCAAMRVEIENALAYLDQGTPTAARDGALPRALASDAGKRLLEEQAADLAAKDAESAALRQQVKDLRTALYARVARCCPFEWPRTVCRNCQSDETLVERTESPQGTTP